MEAGRAIQRGSGDSRAQHLRFLHPPRVRDDREDRDGRRARRCGLRCWRCAGRRRGAWSPRTCRRWQSELARISVRCCWAPSPDRARCRCRARRSRRRSAMPALGVDASLAAFAAGFDAASAKASRRMRTPPPLEGGGWGEGCEQHRAAGQPRSPLPQGDGSQSPNRGRHHHRRRRAPADGLSGRRLRATIPRAPRPSASRRRAARPKPRAISRCG